MSGRGVVFRRRTRSVIAAEQDGVESAPVTTIIIVGIGSVQEHGA